MKRFFLIVPLILSSSFLFAQTKDQIYKEISPNVFRWVSVNITEYDMAENKTYYKTPHGKEEWYDYDDDGRLIHTKKWSGRMVPVR